MRRKQAVIIVIGSLIWSVIGTGALISGRHNGSPVVAAVSVGSVHRVVPRPDPPEVTRSKLRHVLQLFGVTKTKVRAPVRHKVLPAPRRIIRPHLSFSAAAEQWAASAHVRRMRYCESSDDPTVVSVHGGVTYYGLYQANAGFWTTYGGDASYLSSPFLAPRWLQDEVAYRGFLARGFEPWACA